MRDLNKEHAKYVWGTSIIEPSEYLRIWRYVSLPALLYLLRERRLHFSPPWEFSDLSEGRIARSEVNELALVLEDEERLHLLPTLLQMYTNFVAGCVVNCWHASDTESLAMWHLYTSGSDGMAISTTVGKLMESLASNERSRLNFHVGQVQYVDHYADFMNMAGSEGSNALKCIFQKRLEYAHEQEVRVVVVMPQGKPYPKSALEFPLRDLSFIERTVVSPKFPSWAIPALQDVFTSFGLNLKVERSQLTDTLK